MLVSNYLCIHVICILIVWNSLINFLYFDIKIIQHLSYITNEINAVLFTSNTFKTIQNITQTKSPILDEESIKEAFSKYFDCEFETIMYKLEFDKKKDLFDYIKKSGVSGSASLDFKDAKKLYKEYTLNYLEFEVIFVKTISKL